MKNLNSKASTGSLRQRKMEEQSTTAPRLHERGDKVVVNGAKESLLSILKRHVCDCGKHTGDKLILKFLSTNKITASYDVMVWMFIFMRLNCQEDLYLLITNEYLKKMEKKNDQNQSHQSEKYKSSKKRTLQKFIESAELLISDSVNKKTIYNSIGALYSKGKSKENALLKIETYLEKINFNQCLEFTQSSCSLRSRDPSQKDLMLTQQRKSQQKNTLQLASDNSEDKISQAKPLQENTYEGGEMLEDYESMSYWYESCKETYDLFEELIQNKDLDGLRGSY